MSLSPHQSLDFVNMIAMGSLRICRWFSDGFRVFLQSFHALLFAALRQKHVIYPYFLKPFRIYADLCASTLLFPLRFSSFVECVCFLSCQALPVRPKKIAGDPSKISSLTKTSLLTEDGSKSQDAAVIHATSFDMDNYMSPFFTTVVH